MNNTTDVELEFPTFPKELEQAVQQFMDGSKEAGAVDVIRTDVNGRTSLKFCFIDPPLALQFLKSMQDQIGLPAEMVRKPQTEGEWVESELTKIDTTPYDTWEVNGGPAFDENLAKLCRIIEEAYGIGRLGVTDESSISDFPAYLGAIEKVSAAVCFEVKEGDLLVDIARRMTGLKLNQSIQKRRRKFW